MLIRIYKVAEYGSKLDPDPQHWTVSKYGVIALMIPNGPGWLSILLLYQGGANVHVDTVLKTPQFWLLFTTSTLLATVEIQLQQDGLID